MLNHVFGWDRNAATVGLIILSISSMCMADDEPVGHNKPFGYHKPPSVNIEEYSVENAPDPESFFEKHVKPSRAAIFRGAVAQSPAFLLWTDEYLKENFGDMELRMEGKYDSEMLHPVGEKYLGRDTIRHFVDHYHNPDSNYYAVSDVPSTMYRDIGVIPSLGACGEMSRRFVEIDIWWSGGESRSVIHKDAFNQMNCLINGTKYWKLIEYKYEKFIYKHEEPSFELAGYSDLDPDSIDLEEYPLVKQVEWSNFTIHPGDCLYLPRSYYHQVYSTGTHNLAVSILFGRFDNKEMLDFSDCTSEMDYRKLRRLSEFDIQWAWIGSGDFVMGRTDLEFIRSEIIRVVEECNERGVQLTWKTLEDELASKRRESLKFVGNFSKAFDLIDKNKDTKLTVEEVEKLTWDDLRAFGLEMEPYESSNSYTFEYSMVTYETVVLLLGNCLREHEKLTLEEWVDSYKELGGTEMFAKEIFDKLGGGATFILRNEVTLEKVEYALENWKRYWAPQYNNDEMSDVADYKLHIAEGDAGIDLHIKTEL